MNEAQFRVIAKRAGWPACEKSCCFTCWERWEVAEAAIRAAVSALRNSGWAAAADALDLEFGSPCREVSDD